MPGTPIGSNSLTAFTRRFLERDVIDEIYLNALLTYRLLKANKRTIQGGSQIEQSVQYKHITSTGWYIGFDTLDVTPQDIYQNTVWLWKNLYVNIAFDGPTLEKNDSDESIASLIETQWESAREEGTFQLATALWSDGSNNAVLDGIPYAIDTSTATIPNYAGIDRSNAANAWWRANVDSATTTLSIAALQSMMGLCTMGRMHPTIIATNQTGYNRLFNLLQPQQRFITDESMASAGFLNLSFNGVPCAVDSFVPAGTGISPYFFINENYVKFWVKTGRDWLMMDFTRPANQDAYVAPLFWMGNVGFVNVARQGKMSAIAA